MANDLLDRLSAVRRPFRNALIIGHDFGGLSAELAAQGIKATTIDPGFRAAQAATGTQCEEDRLPFTEGAFDLVMALGTLDTVNDLPGALLLIRRVLMPEGLFLGAMMGAGCLPTLRAAFAQIDSGARGVARFHPAIDVRAAGDLLSRAGFAMPVAETETIITNYSDGRRLLSDLRANGCSNVLAQRHPLSRRSYKALIAALSPANGNSIEEKFAILTLTGWRPASKAERLIG